MANQRLAQGAVGRLPERLPDRFIAETSIGEALSAHLTCTHSLSASAAHKTPSFNSHALRTGKKPFYRQAKTEIELLKELNLADPQDQWFIVQLRDIFVHRNHQASSACKRGC